MQRSSILPKPPKSLDRNRNSYLVLDQKQKKTTDRKAIWGLTPPCESSANPKTSKKVEQTGMFFFC